MIKKVSSAAAFTLIELLVVITIIGILAGIALPVFQSVSVKGSQTKALAQAKQIGLALKLFAGDNEGVYPKVGTPAELAGVAGSNDAFACLFPTYCQSETIFANKRSAYNTKVPDNHIDPSYTGTRTFTLANGENAYAYMMNLSDSGNPAWPLVMDAPSTTGNPTYPLGGPTVPGSVWDGKYAIIICLDNSGSLAKVDGTSFTVKRTDVASGANILIPVAASGTDPGWANGGILELPQ
jgi:prepilin-type N-terminal cleavage/methylation domain-containing protein